MAARDPNTILRLRGRLSSGATTIANDFPHGGTALGDVRDLAFHPNIRTFPIPAEEHGMAITQGIYEGTDAVFVAVLRSFDSDAIAAIFPDSFAGAVSGERVIRGETDTIPSGRMLAQDAITLLFTPESPEHHPFILIHNALPVVDSAQVLQLHAGTELGMLVSFMAMPNTAGQMWQVGRRRDLVFP